MDPFDIFIEVLTYFIAFVIGSAIVGLMLIWVTDKVSKL